MTFTWAQWLDQRGIAYKQAGRDNVRVACPWCNDGGNPNMQISLRDLGWHCWANSAHRGVGPARLLAALAGIPLDEARLLTGQRGVADSPLSPIDRVQHIFAAAPTSQAQQLPELRLPTDFKPFGGLPSAAPFVSYLVGRGFRPGRIAHFTDNYGLYYCRHGRWRYRIIFSLLQHGKLCGWTGRSIAADAQLRYLAAGHVDGALPTTDTLLWLDALTGGRRLLLCEGPFDALKLRELGEAATCFFTAAPSPTQIELLRAVLPRYRQRVLLLDRGTAGTALAVQRDMAGMGLEVRILRDHKDPGAITTHAELDNVLHHS